MSASRNSVIEHRANYYYLKLEEDYLSICQGSHCKAAILSILEHWMNSKIVNGLDVYTYMSYPQWSEAMYGLYKRNTIITCLSELVVAGYVLRKPYIDEHNQKTYKYCLNVEKVQEALRALPEQGSVKINYGSPKKDDGSLKTNQGGSPKKDDGSSKKGRNIYSPPDSASKTGKDTHRPASSKAPTSSKPQEPDVCVSSSFSNQSSSQETNTQQEKKQAPFTELELSILVAWEQIRNFPLDRSAGKLKEQVSFIASLIEQEHISLADLPELIRRAEKTSFAKDGGLNFAKFKYLLANKPDLLKNLTPGSQEPTDDLMACLMESMITSKPEPVEEAIGV